MRVRFSGVSVISLTMLPVGRLSKRVRARSKAATSVYRDVALWELPPRITVSGKPSVWQARNDGRVLQRSRHLIGSCFVLVISKLGQLGFVLRSGSLQVVRAPVYETLPPTSSVSGGTRRDNHDEHRVHHCFRQMGVSAARIGFRKRRCFQSRDPDVKT